MRVMLTAAEIAELRAHVRDRRPPEPAYWCDLVDGPLAGLRVGLPMATAKALRRYYTTATIVFGGVFPTGYVGAVYRPAGRRRLAYVKWSRIWPKSDLNFG